MAAVRAAAATARVEEAALMVEVARAAAAEKAEAAPAGEGMVAAVMVVEGSVPQMVEAEARVTDTLVAAVMGEAAMVAAPEAAAAAAWAAAARPAVVAVVAHRGPNRPQRADCVLRRCRFRCSRRDRLHQCIPYLAGRRIERPLTPGRRSDR